MEENKLEELEQERLEQIKRINEIYKKKKDKLKNICPELEDFVFDMITDAQITTNGIRYTKRKVIFLHHLNKYFSITPKDIENNSQNSKEPLGENDKGNTDTAIVVSHSSPSDTLRGFDNQGVEE